MTSSRSQIHSAVLVLLALVLPSPGWSEAGAGLHWLAINGALAENHLAPHFQLLAMVQPTPAPTPSGAEAGSGADLGWWAINRAIVEGHIVPRYRLLAQSTAALDAQLQRLCSGPTEVVLDLVRSRFVSALEAWSGVSHIRFGPMETDQRWYRMQFWPDKRGTGPRQLRQLLADQDTSILGTQGLAPQSVAVQGLSALEMLLFPADEVTVTDFGTADAPSYRCLLAAAIGRNLAEMAAAVQSEWTQGERPYRDLLLDPQRAGGPSENPVGPQLTDSRAVSTELLRSLNAAAQVIVELKLSEPLGPNPEAAHPHKAESWRSRRSLANICTNLRALEHLYATGFALLLSESQDSAQIDRDLTRDLTEAVSTCLQMPPTTLDAPPNPEQRATLEGLRTLAASIRTRTGAPLADALQLNLGFNSLDGD